ncbi:MAG TPA: PAS domain S-box protein [Pseudorhizobium sp.]|nr:PAS domain S-box protein [Pseudorhizobium sp.]
MAALFEQAAAGVALTDLTGRFIRANHCYCAMVDREHEELLRLRMQDITHPEDLPRNKDLFARLVEGGELFHIEKRYVRPDGSTVWAKNAVSAIRSTSGELVSIVAVCVDITARMNAEVALRESEARKSAILQTALDCIITIDQDGQILDWNPAAELTFGHSAAIALGQDLAQVIIPPELREMHYKGMARYLETGEGPVLGRRVELEALRSDGSRFPVELAITATSIQGRQLFTAYLRDISERRRSESALRESEARITATFENAFAGISEVDPNGRFIRVNEELCRVTGYSRDELMKLRFQDITPPEDLPKDHEQFVRQMTNEISVYQMEKRFVHKSGSHIWVDLSASRVDDDQGRPLYGVRVVRDVSERKRAQEHQKLLIDELNHRVKNTLATVQSIASQTLRHAETPEQARSAIEGRLLALSRAHDVLTRENWEAAGLSEIVAQALAPYENGGAKRLRIEGPDVRLSPRMALALAMALQELATNAAKYGALSNDTGAVHISWAVNGAASRSRLHLSWEEVGGPPVDAPNRRGFGSRLIERSLAQELDGEVKIDFVRAGLVCTVDVPLG